MVRSRNVIATPPGATIREQLVDRGMSQKEFAARMDLSEKHVSKLINGDVQLTPEMAVRLEMVLGVPAKFWNNLEAVYREKLVKVNAENTMDTDIELAKKFPYNEMAKNKWVPETKDTKEKVIYLRKYFEVVELGLLQSNQITRIACRRLAITEKSDLALMAWAQKAKIEARKMETDPINLKALKAFFAGNTQDDKDETRDVLRKIEGNAGELWNRTGFPAALEWLILQGASFLDGNKVVVGITARGRDADKFWFSLFHELAHIILGHVGQAEGTSEQDEQDANIWAGNTLIPEKDYSDFKLQKDYTWGNVRKFADAAEIAPGIVVGRLQNDGCIQHSMLNELKEHYVIKV